MTRQDRLIFFIACLGMLLFGITITTLGSVADVLRQRFDLDAVGSGALFSVLPFGILTGSLVFGPVADRYGYRIVLQIAAAFLVAGFLGIARAPSLGILSLCVFLFGFGGGCINGGTSAVVSDISSGSKSGNLSLLGVFFALGGLTVPVVIASLGRYFEISAVLSAIGCLPVVFGLLAQFVPFHKAKQLQGVSSAQIAQLLKDNVLLLIAFFLFFQSGFEGIVNNWTVSYAINWFTAAESLYALSLYVASMAAMRIILGSFFRNSSAKTIMLVSMAMLAGASGLLLSYVPGLFFAGILLLGAGLAAGFPVMLGIIGSRFPDVSGTAFSVVISIALIGNIAVNAGMGLITAYTRADLPLAAAAMTGCMSVLAFFILSKLKSNP